MRSSVWSMNGKNRVQRRVPIARVGVVERLPREFVFVSENRAGLHLRCVLAFQLLVACGCLSRPVC